MIILVVGMHRSGTSLVARGLHAMGANLGARVDTEPHPANPHGHWEHADVWRAQERLLIRFGREWHSSPGPLPERWLEWPDTGAVIDRFAGLALDELARGDHWLVKDPRSSLLIPLWKTVAGRVGTTLRILRVDRDAAEVARSLLDRNGMPPDLALRIWADHQRRIDVDAAGLESRTFRHDAIMRDPLAAFTALGEYCALPAAASRAAVAARLVDPALWHHRGAAPHGGGMPPPAPDRPPDDRGRVLVVVRTRWRLRMLPRALRSVLAQTYRHWFLQVVNDGGPVHVVESEIDPYRHLLEGRLGVIHLAAQRGMEAASNVGVRARSSEFVAIHDDDDAWSPDFLERMVARLHATGRGAAVSRTRVVREARDGEDYVRRQTEEFGPDLPQVTATDLAIGNLFPPIALLFRRRAYDAAGGFHEGLPALGDWHFNRRLAALEPIDVHPETLAFWHVREPSDAAPNSPRIDHRRMDSFVRAWPMAATPPDFFAQARQVRVWGDAAQLVGADRVPLAAVVTAPPGEEPAVLPAGLYLLQLPTAAGGTQAQARPAALRTRCAGHQDQVVPLARLSDERTSVLVNAPAPIVGLALEAAGGRVEPLPAAAEVVRLGAAVERLDDFAGSPRLPDVLGIGAQRAGTTWLHAALQGHPEVWACGIKEFHHFDWDGSDPTIGAFRQAQALGLLRALPSGLPDRERTARMLLRHAFPPSHTWETYAAAFAAAPHDHVACDFTPAYATLDEEVVAEIVRVMPRIKVIFLLRDPVTRAISGALHELHRSGIERPTEAQLRAACNDPANVTRTDYLRTLDIWRRQLPEQQLLVLFHDDIARDPAGVIRRTCGFLGISPAQPPAAPQPAGGPPRNAGRTRMAWPELARVKAELSRRWLPMLESLERRVGEPVRPWRLAAEARLRAAEAARSGAGSTRANTVIDNLAQWDVHDPWTKDGDEWDGQARLCGLDYEDWKTGIVARHEPLIPAGGTILEIGPGHGRWSEWLVARGGLLVLCDISPNCLDACRGRLTGRGRFRTHLVQAADLPADLSGAVDVVWSYDCLVHVGAEECARYLVEIARVLRPGGVAVLHHADRPARVRRAVTNWWRPAAETGRGNDVDSGWRSVVDRSAIRRWARQAGLRVASQESTWTWDSPRGPVQVGVPRFGDCITVLRRDDPRA